MADVSEGCLDYTIVLWKSAHLQRVPIPHLGSVFCQRLLNWAPMHLSHVRWHVHVVRVDYSFAFHFTYDWPNCQPKGSRNLCFHPLGAMDYLVLTKSLWCTNAMWALFHSCADLLKEPPFLSLVNM